jgi:hypothetical protein
VVVIRARSGLAESGGFPKRRESDSICWLGLEASRDGASLFFGPAGAGGCGGGGGSVLPFGGQDVHGQRRQRCEVVAAPPRRRQSGGAEDGRPQALPCGARAGLGSDADRREAGSDAASSAQGTGRARPCGQRLCALAFSAAPRRDVQKKSLRASEQDRPDVARRRERWKARQATIDPSRLVFIDETPGSSPGAGSGPKPT